MGDHFRSGSASALGLVVVAGPCEAATLPSRRPLATGKSREESPVPLYPFPRRDGDGPSHRARAPAPPRAAFFPDRGRRWVRGARARERERERSGGSRQAAAMSVAFAAPRQRGKGEITPAAIQKVSRARGGGPGPARPGRPRGLQLPLPAARGREAAGPHSLCPGLGPRSALAHLLERPGGGRCPGPLQPSLFLLHLGCPGRPRGPELTREGSAGGWRSGENPSWGALAVGPAPGHSRPCA